MTQEYTQDEINAILASIEVDDAQIAASTKSAKLSMALRGLKRTPEQNKANGERHKGIKPSAEATEKNRQAQMGRVYTPERNKKISDAKKGKKRDGFIPANKDKEMTQAQKDKISETKTGAVLGPQSVECNLKKAASLTPYEFITPKGVFDSLYAATIAFDGEYITPQLFYLTKKGVRGFSRRLKDV